MHRCAPGMYSPSTGMSTCYSCPIGKFIPTSGSTSCLICDYDRISVSIGAKNCSQCPGGQIADRNHVNCIDNPGDTLASTSIVHILYSKGVAVALAMVVASIFVLLAVFLHMKYRGKDSEVLQLPWMKVILKSALPGFSLGSELFVIITLTVELPWLAWLMLSFRLLHVVSTSVLVGTALGPEWMKTWTIYCLKSLSLTTLADDIQIVSSLLDKKYCLVNVGPIGAIILFALFETTMTVFLPWRSTLFSRASEGYPTLSIMKLIMGNDFIQALLATMCQLYFLSSNATLGNGDPATRAQAIALFSLNITLSFLSVSIGLITWCVRGNLLAEIDQARIKQEGERETSNPLHIHNGDKVGDSEHLELSDLYSLNNSEANTVNPLRYISGSLDSFERRSVAGDNLLSLSKQSPKLSLAINPTTKRKIIDQIPSNDDSGLVIGGDFNGIAEQYCENPQAIQLDVEVEKFETILALDDAEATIPQDVV